MASSLREVGCQLRISRQASERARTAATPAASGAWALAQALCPAVPQLWLGSPFAQLHRTGHPVS
eukprot:1067074-Alexandrium_andersonii.AAC.1